MSAFAVSVSPEAAASWNLRIAVFSDDFTDLLRSRRFSFCLLRLICDLMFATRQPRPDRSGVEWDRTGHRAHHHARRASLPARPVGHQNGGQLVEAEADGEAEALAEGSTDGPTDGSAGGTYG